MRSRLQPGWRSWGPSRATPDVTTRTRDQIHDELAAELRDFPHGGTSLVPDADDPFAHDRRRRAC